MSIPTVVPTRADVEALHQFLQDRGEEQWQQTLASDELPEADFDNIRRLNNSHKNAVSATSAALLHALGRFDTALAATMWHALTGCGEQWSDHPSWETSWRNPARAALEDVQ